MTNVKMAASHPDHPVLTPDELLDQVRGVTHRIEMCGASPELTNAVTASSDLYYHLKRYLEAEAKRNQSHEEA